MHQLFYDRIKKNLKKRFAYLAPFNLELLDYQFWQLRFQSENQVEKFIATLLDYEFCMKDPAQCDRFPDEYVSLSKEDEPDYLYFMPEKVVIVNTCLFYDLIQKDHKELAWLYDSALVSDIKFYLTPPSYASLYPNRRRNEHNDAGSSDSCTIL